MNVYEGTSTAAVLKYNHSTIVQLDLTSVIHKQAVTIKFSGNLDLRFESVQSTFCESA